MEKTWIRRDRDTGKEEEVTAEYVRRLINYSTNAELVMMQVSKEMPWTTGFADYYPKS